MSAALATDRAWGSGLADDPAVPSRDALLDGHEVAARLGALAGTRGPVAVQACEVVRAKYRAGESLRAVYRLQVDDEEHWIAARTLPPDRARRTLRGALAGAAPSGRLRPVVHVPELGAVFWAFPNDRRIADLRLLVGGLALERLVGRPVARTELVAWAPEATATARCLAASGRVVAYAKVYADDQAPRTDAVHTALARCARSVGDRAPLVPRVLGCSPARRALALQAMRGRPLLELRGAERVAGVRALGAALAVLQALPVPPGAPRLARLDADRLTTAAEVIGFARPDVRAAAHELAGALRDGARALAPVAPACLHGDPHPGNVVVAGGRIALVDLDHVAGGPPAADLARVLAGLTAERLAGGLDAATERELAAALLAGYDEVRRPPAPAALHWHAAATLLARHAQTAVGRVRPAALANLPALIAGGRELLR
ncbi:MAG: Phosphotransferase enzyme family [Solirubrobacteraceae bacterium]|nr:Phosphotransferase enzyme family [Solirubrobacteraceae bacterium]